MIHVCIHTGKDNSERRMGCGIVGKLPPGDTFYYDGEALAYHKADCPGCNPGGPEPLGTPISQLATQPGCKGYAAWLAISESWGHG